MEIRLVKNILHNSYIFIYKIDTNLEKMKSDAKKLI